MKSREEGERERERERKRERGRKVIDILLSVGERERGKKSTTAVAPKGCQNKLW
jgi:hypothetical protein